MRKRADLNEHYTGSLLSCSCGSYPSNGGEENKNDGCFDGFHFTKCDSLIEPDRF